MNKFLYSALLCLVGIFSFTACTNTSSYSYQIEQEEKLIAAYLNRNNCVILSQFPEDSVFAENEFYHVTDGIYFQLIDKGVGDTALSYDNIVLRYSKSTLDEYPVIEDYLTTQDRPYPNQVTYGSTTGSCEGWYAAMHMMKRTDSRARFIVPSKLGFEDDQNSVTPYLYEMNIKILPR